MAHALTLLPLRLGLAVLRRRQRLPAPEAALVARAARLRLGGGERRAEAGIDALRRRLRASDATVEIVDHGAGSRGPNAPVRRVADVYRWAATGPAGGRFLFGLARAQRPRRVLELGTNLGVGAGHLAAALCVTAAEGGPAGRLVTLEGAPGLAALAAGHLARLGHPVGHAPDDRVRIVVGAFAETLPDVLRDEGPFDLVFIDGHHDPEAALGYLRQVEPHLAEGALVILDDVGPGQPVRAAWRRLRAEREGDPLFFAGQYGLIFASRDGGAAPAVARETLPSLQAAPAGLPADA
ncbi:MAG: class I SAM-dependent methyltransferase [Bacteroidota bacterium]